MKAKQKVESQQSQVNRAFNALEIAIQYLQKYQHISPDAVRIALLACLVERK